MTKRDLKKYIERWQQALRVLRSLTPKQRREEFDMSIWGIETSCGTSACAAGWCGMDPWFRKRGLRMEFDPSGSGHFPVKDPIDFFDGEGSNIFFGRGSVGQVIREVRSHIKKLEKQLVDA